ncbi:uncharacterized protein LOC133795163 [Humulus lupulus]|uniref:uncharacterized protein LOC133795163 n=1 Tax=Humulus lupulus TaxID=3486 RepID=UPI002B4159BB|nr:uncharacterized protein LOC133795163 [Humulus lupulus]
MFRARKDWFRALNQFKLAKIGKPFSSNPTTTGSTSKGGGSGGGDKTESSLTKYDESYRQLDNLDFMTAAKILFTDPPKEKKFGHFVEHFYELEVKKKKEDEKKAKELELKAIEEKETGNPELWEVKTRLDKLEESLKKIVAESKQPGNGAVKNNERDVEKKDFARTETGSSKE